MSLIKEDTKRASILITLLNNNRVSNHNDWFYIGQLLYNIDENSLEDWINFSQDRKDECINYWDKMQRKRVSFRYLLQMVKEDNPKEYIKFTTKDYKKLLVNFLDECKFYKVGSKDIAKVLHNKYGHKFICSLPKKNIWYELVNNEWCLSENNTSLMRIISNDLCNDFLELFYVLISKTIKLNGDNKKKVYNKIKRIQQICDKLFNNLTFKNQIIEHAKDIFYEDNFYEIIIKENLKNQNIEKGRILITLLNDKRVSNHNDWLYVGQFLHNLDKNLLEDWQNFSQQYPDKKEKCKEYWLDMTSKNISFRYLIQMAKEDNYEEYKKFINSKLEFLEINNTYYIAESLYNKYGDNFVCTSNDKNIWYKFVNNQWQLCSDNTLLMSMICADFSNDFAEIKKNLFITLKDEKNDDIPFNECNRFAEYKKLNEKYIKNIVVHNKISRLFQICDKLFNITFIKKIMEHAKNIFYEENFYENNIAEKELINKVLL